MKNFEKYKTPKEAYEAYNKECLNHRSCKACPYSDNGKPDRCEFRWLYKDIPEPKTTPQWQNNLMDKFTRKD